jgi:hypothetical protein
MTAVLQTCAVQKLLDEVRLARLRFTKAENQFATAPSEPISKNAVTNP